MSVKVIIAVFVCLIAGLLTLALREPAPGMHDWFHRLSGDWAVKIEGTDCEIGNSLDLEHDGRFRVFRWAPFTGSDGNVGYVPKTLIDGVLSFQSVDGWILVRTSTGWGAIEVPTGRFREEAEVEGLAGWAPETLLRLSDRMIVPRPSYKVHGFLLSGALAVAGVILLVRTAVSCLMVQKRDIIVAVRRS